jgi:hypothetical protein
VQSGVLENPSAKKFCGDCNTSFTADVPPHPAVKYRRPVPALRWLVAEKQ